MVLAAAVDCAVIEEVVKHTTLFADSCVLLHVRTYVYIGVYVPLYLCTIVLFHGIKATSRAKCSALLVLVSV